jgi:hypothetical protein
VNTESQTEIPDHLKDLYDKSCEHLSLEQTDKLAEVLIKHQSVFSKSPHDLGCTDLVEHAIVTGNAKPINQRPYRIPLSKKVEVEKEIKSMAERGIIQPSCSPWCSPIVMVTKNDGTIHFCCDFRRLNKETVKDCQLLPRIDDTLVALSGLKCLV